MDLHITDPEFMERLDHFMLEEVINEPGQQLPDKTRYMAVLATLIGCQGIDEFKIILDEALKSALTPVEIKEIVYQSIDYLGIGRSLPFLTATNEIFLKKGIKFPLEGQSTTNFENRLQKGGGRCAGTDFWRWNERSMESGAYKSLACRKLFW